MAGAAWWLTGRRVVCCFVIAQKIFSMHVGAMSRVHGGCVAMHILFGVSQFHYKITIYHKIALAYAKLKQIHSN
jgi:hypothetical protein